MKKRKARNAGSIGARIWMHEPASNYGPAAPIDDAIKVIREAHSKGVTFSDTAESVRTVYE